MLQGASIVARPEQKFNGKYEKSNEVCDERALFRDQAAHHKDRPQERLREFSGLVSSRQGASEKIDSL